MALETDYSSSRHEVLPSFRFTLMVEGGVEIPLKSIRPFQKENEFEVIEEGGMNDFVRIRRKHATKPHTIQVERYVNENFYDPIPNGGAEFILPLLLFVGANHALKFGWVGAERVFVFFGATVMNREIGGFDSEKSGLLTETITIAYNQLFSMDIPGESSFDPWTFANGIANSYANQGWMGKIEQNNVKKAEFITKASDALWSFGDDATVYTGEGPRVYSSIESNIPQNVKKKSALEANAKKETWHFGKDETEYEGAFGARHYEEEEKKVKKNLVTKSTLVRKAKGETWHFGEGPDDYKGNEKLHSENGQPVIPQNKATKRALAREASEKTYHMSDGVKGVIDAPELTQKAEGETWKFTNAESYKGNGKQHAPSKQETIAQNAVEKTQLSTEAEEKTWGFEGTDPGKYKGNGVTHSSTGQEAIAQNAVEVGTLSGKAEGETWHFGATAGESTGNDKRHVAPPVKGEAALEQLTQVANGAQWPNARHAMLRPDGQEPTDVKTLSSQAANNTWPRTSHALKAPGSKEALLKG